MKTYGKISKEKLVKLKKTIDEWYRYKSIKITNFAL